jgi:hypothetical protein
MRTRLEDLLVNGSKVGALVRVEDGSGLHTQLCFVDPGGEPIWLESHIDYQGDPRSWVRFRYSQHHVGVHRDLTRPAGVPADTIPSYASFLLVEELASGNDSTMDYHCIVEGEPERGPVPMKLRRTGGLVEEVGPLGTGNRHWIDASGLTRSDWQGAESRRVDDVSSVLDGLSDDHAASVRAFLGQYETREPQDRLS